MYTLVCINVFFFYFFYSVVMRSVSAYVHTRMCNCIHVYMGKSSLSLLLVSLLLVSLLLVSLPGEVLVSLPGEDISKATPLGTSVFTTSVFTTSVFTTSVFTTSVFTTSVRIYGLVRFAVIPAALVLVFHFSFEFFFRIFFLVFRSVCAVSLLGNCGLMVPAAEAWIPFQALFFLFFFCFFVV